jgi:predicted  nucleic acid-binding Zn-ribbon protein
MADQNGLSRLDRIERAIEALVDDHIKLVDEHLKFQLEHKQLLTAQVVLTDRLDRLTDRVDRVGDRVDKLAENVEKMRIEFAEAHKHADARLNSLIAVVDGIIRKRE